jgi:hypothetical protein
MALVTMGGPADAASAGLSSRDWTEPALPANYLVANGTNGSAGSPVSCVQGTRFCLAIVSDMATLISGSFVSQAALVTTSAGRTWSGYASLPASLYPVTALSCASARVCWATGYESGGGPGIAQTTDGGRTWTDQTPAAWATAGWRANAIDCVTASTCWLAGAGKTDDLQNPVLVSTTNGGRRWTVTTNLPDAGAPSGSYALNGISCVSARSCVAVGGLGGAAGTGVALSTGNGGATWKLSSFSGIQPLWSVSCVPGGRRQQATCFAAGSTTSGAGSVTVMTRDGGLAWTGQRDFANGGWFSSISCASASHCWAAGADTTQALIGTANGGGSWSPVTADTATQDGSVSCLSVNICVATTDNGLWVTTDDGGLSTRAGR